MDTKNLINTLLDCYSVERIGSHEITLVFNDHKKADEAQKLLKNISETSDDYIGIELMVSDKQKTLEANGCHLKTMEVLDKHELDPKKDCFCGRPNK